jgi:hypothetical protein
MVCGCHRFGEDAIEKYLQMNAMDNVEWCKLAYHTFQERMHYQLGAVMPWYCTKA